MMRRESRYGSAADLFKQQNQGFDTSQILEEKVTTPPSSLAAREADRNEEGQFSAGNPYSIQPGSSRLGQASQEILPGERAWQTPGSRDPLLQEPVKPAYTPPPPVQRPVDSHPARLAWPKMPGSL
jgi:hypothetical protein